MSDILKTAKEVLALDGKATGRPWYRAAWSENEVQIDGEGAIVARAFIRDDAALIAHYRTSAPALARAIIDYEKLKTALAEYDHQLASAICKEPPCMYGSNERIYIMSLIEAAARARRASRDTQSPQDETQAPKAKPVQEQSP